jgi:hypothetical protein
MFSIPYSLRPKRPCSQVAERIRHSERGSGVRCDLGAPGSSCKTAGILRCQDHAPERGVGALLLGGLDRRVRLRWQAD